MDVPSSMVRQRSARAAGCSFRADRAWFYLVLLSIGYMVSRGLASPVAATHNDA